MKGIELVRKKSEDHKTVILVNDIEIGADQVVPMAGPCAVENKEQLVEIASELKQIGVPILRGGAFKPRTSPYAFMGLGTKGLELLAEAKEETGMAIVTEVMDPGDISSVEPYADILQIGSRNMQNFPLLMAAGKAKKPVLLKRGLAATIQEWLLAAEYIMVSGNEQVILCERGIRTFENFTRNTIDLAAVPIVKSLTHLPVIVDPSHGTGIRELVTPVSKGAVAMGADGLLIEVHTRPEEALCDGDQSLTPSHFKELLEQCEKVAVASGKKGIAKN
ncbi:3-deoxy-7-phosphoheptulonate synthase [Desulfitispora alkaliphila]|uniref:3-deoxy-7-phosphoheptulonate synthase n=1 Tax=Desulfitispora alkaliphila TaxID=622674 RepID=UPI003D1E1CAC